MADRTNGAGGPPGLAVARLRAFARLAWSWAAIWREQALDGAADESVRLARWEDDRAVELGRR
jgi:hypothetical protein